MSDVRIKIAVSEIMNVLLGLPDLKSRQITVMAINQIMADVTKAGELPSKAGSPDAK